VNLEEADEWLEKAESDFGQAQAAFKREDFSYAGFWMQQAAEKALKALLLDKFEEYPYSHNLLGLSQNLDVPDHHKDYFPELNTVYTNFVTLIRPMKNLKIRRS
jgi:HEPN domain-containing protein